MAQNKQGFQKLNEEKESQGNQKKVVPASPNKGGHSHDKHYDEDQIPPNWALAEDHLLARRVGEEVLPDIVGGKAERCDCCSYVINRKELSVFCDTTEFSFLGSGYPLFFNFIKFCVLVLFLMLLSSGAYNMFSNAVGGDCLTDRQIIKKYFNGKQPTPEVYAETLKSNPDICALNWLTAYSIANKRSSETMIAVQGWLNVLTILVIIVALQFFRYKNRVITDECDKADLAASDYTVVVKNIPTNLQGVQIDQELKKLFEEKGLPNERTQVKAISLCYDLTEQIRLQNEKQKVNVLYQKALSQFNEKNVWPDGKTQKQFQDEIKGWEQKLEDLEAELQTVDKDKRPKATSKYFCGVAFVSFMTESQKEQCAEQNKQSTWQRFRQASGCQSGNTQHRLYYKGKQLIVEEAADPTDVFWENLHVTTKTKFIRRMGTTALTFVILIACGYSIFSLQSYQVEENARSKGKPSTTVKIIGAAVSFIIVAINVALGLTIKKFAEVEAYTTRTRYNISIAQKSSIAQFVNTAFMTFLITYFYIKNYYGTGGLIYNQTMVFLTNAFVPVIANAVNAPYYIKRFLRNKEKQKGDKSVKTQKEAQLLFENPEYDISKQYADLMKTMFFTAFYAPIIPSGIAISMFGLMMMYWVQKYNVLKRSIIKYNQGSELSQEMTEYLEFVCIIYAGSNFMFSRIIFGHASWTSIIGLLLGVVNAALPMETINTMLFKFKESEETKTYDEAFKNFDTDYERENPATKEEAVDRLNDMEVGKPPVKGQSFAGLTQSQGNKAQGNQQGNQQQKTQNSNLNTSQQGKK